MKLTCTTNQGGRGVKGFSSSVGFNIGGPTEAAKPVWAKQLT